MEIVKAVVAKAPHQRGVDSYVELEVPTDGINKASCIMLINVFYKLNFISRHVLKEMLAILGNPKNDIKVICEYLVNEAAKA